MVKQTRFIIKSLDTFITRIVRAIVTDLVANLVAPPPLGTPRDTGWAASNWIAYIGNPLTEAVGTRENVSNAPQQAALAAIISTYSLDDGRAGVNNNVPYVLKLNDGSSAQSPRAFVQIAIMKTLTLDLPRQLRRLARRL